MATIYADHIPVTQERIEYRAYDEFGKMTNHWGAATYDVAYAYDLAGNQVSLTDGNGNTTRWEYDGRNRKVRKIYADNSDYEYGYDANGNQTRKRDAMQRTTRYEFNAYNLLVRTDYPNDPDVTFGYDPAGPTCQDGGRHRHKHLGLRYRRPRTDQRPTQCPTRWSATPTMPKATGSR